MSRDAGTPSGRSDGGTSVAIEDMLHIRQHTILKRLFASQAFWVMVALIIICVAMSVAVTRHGSPP